MGKGKGRKTNERITKEVDMTSVLNSKRKRKPSPAAVEAKKYQDAIHRKPIKKGPKTGKIAKKSTPHCLSFVKSNAMSCIEVEGAAKKIKKTKTMADTMKAGKKIVGRKKMGKTRKETAAGKKKKTA